MSAKVIPTSGTKRESVERLSLFFVFKRCNDLVSSVCLNFHKMKWIFIVSFWLVVGTVNSQILVQSMSTQEASAYRDMGWVAWQGELKRAKMWGDSLGSNLLFISLYADDKANRIVIFARHYIGDAGNYSLLWDLMDFVNVDWTADGEPRLQLVVVEDTDMNGVAETYLGYTLYGDVTDCCYPNPLKVIVHEGSSKYAIRGMTEVEYDKDNRVGGKDMNGGNSIESASSEIQQRANKMYDYIAQKLFIRMW